MKYLVTGHLGYIGGNIYRKLQEEGHEVVGIDKKNGWEILDTIDKIDGSFDGVFHLAAEPSVQFSVEHPTVTMKRNVLVSSKVLEWSKNNGVKKVVFSSSAAVLGTGDGPTSPYGLHKKITEQECKLYSKLYNLDTVSLRYFNVFSADQPFGGAYSTAICAWKHLIGLSKPLRIDGDGTQTRDFIHVDDIVSANLFVMNHENEFKGSIFEVGTGKSISLNTIKQVIDQNYEIDWNFALERVGDIKHSCSNPAPLRKLGWSNTVEPIEAIQKIFTKKR